MRNRLLFCVGLFVLVLGLCLPLSPAQAAPKKKVAAKQAKQLKQVKRQLNQARKQIRTFRATLRSLTAEVAQIKQETAANKPPAGGWLPAAPVADASPFTGTYPNITVKTGGIGDYMLAQGSVGTEAIADFSVSADKLGFLKTRLGSVDVPQNQTRWVEVSCEPGEKAISWGYYWQAIDMSPGVADGAPLLKINAGQLEAGQAGKVKVAGTNSTSSPTNRKLVATLTCLM